MPDPRETGAETDAAGVPSGEPATGSAEAPARTGRTGRPGRARRAAIVGLRLVSGTVGIAAAVAVIAAVGLIPLPTRTIAAPSVLVTPQPADQTRICAGSVLRLGDETGANAATAAGIGAPSVRSGGVGAAVDDAQLAASDAGTGGTSSAPRVLTIPATPGATLSGAQSQLAESPDYRGFTAAACAEPSSSLWLVGGSTSVGRTSLLTLSNASGVDATVALTILGPDGAVSAPGMAGIVVKPGQQRVIPLAGFAPDITTPVVHVVAQGGQVTAYLQQSIVRGLDAGGVDTVDAGVDPATTLVIPGIRIRNAVGANSALALPDWDDVVAAVRVAVPGERPATVQVRLIPQDASLAGGSFEMDVSAGRVSELALDSSAEAESGTVGLPDGDYTVVLESDQPIVGGVRASTVSTGGTDADATDGSAPASDFAWYSSAPALTGDTAVTVAPGPSPELSVSNQGSAAVALVLDAQGGEDLTVNVPAGGSASVPLATGTTYLLTGAKGVVAAVSYAGDALLAAYPVASARPVSSPITVHP